MAVTVTYSGAGATASGFPIEDNRHSRNRIVLQATVVNSEVVTIDHADEPAIIRDVNVIDTSNGQKLNEPAAADTNTGVTIARTDANTTTLTFGSAAAGTYNIVIEY